MRIGPINGESKRGRRRRRGGHFDVRGMNIDINFEAEGRRWIRESSTSHKKQRVSESAGRNGVCTWSVQGCTYHFIISIVKRFHNALSQTLYLHFTFLWWSHTRWSEHGSSLKAERRLIVFAKLPGTDARDRSLLILILKLAVQFASVNLCFPKHCWWVISS